MSWYTELKYLKDPKVFMKWLNRKDKLTFDQHTMTAEELYEKVKPILTDKHIYAAIFNGPLNMFPKLLESEAITLAQKEYIEGFMKRNNTTNADFDPITYYKTNHIVSVDFENPESFSISDDQMIDRLILFDFIREITSDIVLFNYRSKNANGMYFTFGDEHKYEKYFDGIPLIEGVTSDQINFVNEYLKMAYSNQDDKENKPQTALRNNNQNNQEGKSQKVLRK